MLLRYNLEAEGYEVETVGARRRGRHPAAARASPDLVVLDWMLPGLSGIELCRRLRARPETRQLPIIMLTARGEESERVRGPRHRRRRLHRQAVLGAGAAGARARAAAPRQPERVANVLDIGDIELDREKQRVLARRPRRRSRPDRIPPAGIPDGAARPRVLARAAARRRLGLATSISTSAPSTCMSAACARRSTAASEADPIRTVRGAGYALDDRFGRSAA